MTTGISTSTFSPFVTIRRSTCSMTFLTGSRWTSLVIASVVLPSISMANRAFACLSARNVSWPGSDTCSGSEPCPYRTAGIRPARRVRRAAPLPKSVRVVATSLTSDTGTPDEDDDRWGPAVLVASTRDAGRARGGVLPSRSRSWWSGSICGATAVLTVRRPSPRQPDDLTRRGAHPQPGSRAACRGQAGSSGLTVEQRGHRAVVEHLADRAGQQRRDREHRELREPAVFGDGQRVGHDDLARPALHEAVDGRVGQHAVRGSDDHVLGAGLHEDPHRARDGAGGVDEVVDQHAAAALDVAHDPVGDRAVGAADVARLVDERERSTAELGGPLLGDPDAARIGRDDRHVRGVDARPDVLDEERHRPEVVDGAVEEALDLRRVQVDAHQPVRTRGLEQVSHETCRDRLAPAVLLVLARIAVERRDDRDRLRGRPLERVDHEQLLHDPLVDGCRVALQHERVGTADRIPEADVDLAVGEVVRRGRDERAAERLRDGDRQVGVRPPGDQDQPTFSVVRDDAGVHTSSFVVGWASRNGAGVVGRSGGGVGAASPAASWARPRSARACGERSSAAIAASARAAASAAGVPARARRTQPSMLRWVPLLTARAPGGTSCLMTLPAPVYAPSPTVTGAMNLVSEPVRAYEPIVVRCLLTPS